MIERRILKLDAGQASVHLWQKGALRCEASFPADAAGAAAFACHIARQPDSHYALLADVSDEGFQRETIPHVFGRSRTALLQRKLAQAFYGSPLTLAQSLGREKAPKGTGRRDEEVLLLGLTRPEFIEPWLGGLRQADATLSGLYSAPLLSAVLTRRLLRETAPQFILVTFGRAGIRLCFFDAGRLRFSHLGSKSAANKPDQDGVEALAAACAVESARLAAYLQGQRLVSRDATLPCLILAHPEHHAAFAAHCMDSQDLAFRLLDLPTLCRSAGLAKPPEDSDADNLFLHLTATRAPGDQFAPAKDLHLHRLWLARRWYTAMAAAFFGACLLLAGAESWLVLQSQNRAATLRAETRTLSKTYQARLDALPPLATLPENLRTLATSYRALENRSALPGESFAQLSRVLDGFPEVSLSKLEWSVSMSEDGDEGKRPPGAPNSSSFFIVTTLHASLPADAGLRQQMAMADAFHAALVRDPALHGVFLKRPLSLDPGKLLKGGGGFREDTATPEFSLRISRHL